MPLEQEITFMKVRLFKLAQEHWGIDMQQCADIFEKNKIYDYIDELYDLFHVQGDEVNLNEIEEYLRQKDTHK